jgi:hypothetical protein
MLMHCKFVTFTVFHVWIPVTPCISVADAQAYDSQTTTSSSLFAIIVVGEPRFFSVILSLKSLHLQFIELSPVVTLLS